MKSTRDIVALIPAAGRATRLGRTAGSKELFPIGFDRDAAGVPRPRAACEYLLAALHDAGIRTAHVILRAGKWDIPEYLRDGRELGLDLSYLIMRHPFGVPFTLDQAYPFVRASRVALGFPDILFEPRSAFATALARLERSGADAMLGLFPARDSSSCDMVAVGAGGALTQLEVKPERTDLVLTWGIAVWTPRFTEFLHACVQSRLASLTGARHDDSAHPGENARELQVGDVFGRAVESGLRIEGIEVSDRPFLDIGTPETLAEVVRLRSLDATSG